VLEAQFVTRFGSATSESFRLAQTDAIHARACSNCTVIMLPAEDVGHMSFDQPKRAMKMDQQRHRFIDVDECPDKKARTFRLCKSTRRSVQTSPEFVYAGCVCSTIGDGACRVSCCPRAPKLIEREYPDKGWRDAF